MNKGHHLILGRLEDFITGEILDDTHDERLKQNLARLLVATKGYEKKEITPRHRLLVSAGDRQAMVPIDFLISLKEKISMIVKYGPGSLVTRRRPGVAASRLVTPYQVPVVVVTNGEDAEIIDPFGSVVAKARYFEPELLFAHISSAEVQRARAVMPLLSDENISLTLSELNRIQEKI